MALRARKVTDWRGLEDISAAEWLIRLGGRKAYDVIWAPLMKGKFGEEADNVSAVWIWNKLKLRGSSRDKQGAESLVYFDGGFGALTNGIREALEARGVKLHLNTAVQRIETKDGKVAGITLNSGEIKTDTVLCTSPLPIFLTMTPGLPQEYVARHSRIRFLGNCCIAFALERSLSSTYWLNVADPSFPFVGIIEHTNFDPKEHYNGKHIVYLSKYLPTSDPLFSMRDNELVSYCVPFIQRIFPMFSSNWIHSAHVWRAKYSQPVITKGYSSLVPSSQTPVSGLWLSTMAQVYPEDRGTNYAVKYGRQVAREIIDSNL
jgi:protoporphyrinogen oxidase